MDAAPALPAATRETRTFTDRGCGLPKFVLGLEFWAGEHRWIVRRVVSQLHRPERVVVEVEVMS
jgi:hypothetical protein